MISHRKSGSRRIVLGKASRSTRGGVFGAIERVGLLNAGIRLS